MDSAASTSDLTCRLERPDGSVWRVTTLDLAFRSFERSWRSVGLDV